MNIQELIASTRNDIDRQISRLSLFEEMSVVFQDVEIPSDVNIYMNRYNGGNVYVEFSPGYQEESNKDLQPLVHSLCQAFSCSFKKELGYDGNSITYRAEVPLANSHKMSLNVRGVVPGTCRIEEHEEPLAKEDIDAAIAQVPTTRKVRKIICQD